MILGLRHAKGWESKEEIMAVSQELMKKFKKRLGSIMCRDLLDIDLTTPEGQKEAQDKQVLLNVCPEFVKTAAELLEE